jgi:hypothetical protein
MTAARTSEVTPVPEPTQTPHRRISSHRVVISVVRATEQASSARAHRTSRRSPQRSINDAAKGPIKPNRTRLMAIAPEIAALVQPNSDSSGTISTPRRGTDSGSDEEHEEGDAGHDPGVVKSGLFQLNVHGLSQPLC